MCNKTPVGILIAGIWNDTYIKAGIDSLLSNIDLSNYYIKAEIGSLFTNIGLSNYYKSEVDDIDTELVTLVSYLHQNRN